MRGLFCLRCSYDDITRIGSVPVHILDFTSKSQRHVTRSTFASELFAATDALDTGILQAQALHEVLSGTITANEARLMREEGGRSVRLAVVLDALSVHAAIAASVVKTPAEQSLLVHLHWVKSALLSGALTALIWVDTRSMVSDGLTKGVIDRDAIHKLMAGTWSIDQLPKVYVAPDVAKLLEHVHLSHHTGPTGRLCVESAASSRPAGFEHNCWY